MTTFAATSDAIGERQVDAVARVRDPVAQQLAVVQVPGADPVAGARAVRLPGRDDVVLDDRVAAAADVDAEIDVVRPCSPSMRCRLPVTVMPAASSVTCRPLLRTVNPRNTTSSPAMVTTLPVPPPSMIAPGCR